MTSLPETGIRLLEPREGAAAVPAQWGVPWARGAVRELPPLDLVSEDGAAPVDSWVTARWPDGSVKWTGHAGLAPTGEGRLAPRPAGVDDADDSRRVRVEQAEHDGLRVVTDRLALQVGPGPAPLRRLVVEGTEVGVRGRIIATSAETPDPQAPRREHLVQVTAVDVERAGEQQVVLRLEGHHEVAGEEVLPFVLRLYVTAGSPRVRAVHSLVWDADPQRLFLTSLGLRLDVPMRAAPYDRHIRLAGSAGGFLTESVQGVTGLRRDPGEVVRRAQVEGRPTPPLADWAETVSNRLRFVPCWDAWTLRQLSPDGFTVAKRTDSERPWIAAPGGTRSRGYAYVGDTHGGVGIGLRDFWKLHPTQLDVEGARSDAATLTVWMYSPAAEPMDLRFFHDGLGQDTYEDQLEALEITYEDYEPGFGDARGIARTHELVLDAFPATPPAAELAALAEACALPPQPAVIPERMREAGVFGIWSPIDRSTPQRAHLEDRLLFLRELYLREVEQRRWYGFWDYGDVMHTYDADRHTWRYDVGGYAWDNSELSPDLWLWTDFLRSGDAAVFRLAEAMSRHTGEVDQYHAGPFAGLGTRHNVQHWGCSAKQLRVSSALYRRHHYFLTVDERVGELLDAVAASEEALLRVDATRKVRTDVYAPDRRALAIGLGTDLGALLGAWLTAWERHGDAEAEQKIRSALAGIGALPQGFFTGEALWDLETRRFDTTRDRIQVSHLAAVFGLAEVVPELLDLVEDPGFAHAWDEYCRYYLATPEEQTARFGAPLTGISLIPAYSRLLAQHAARADDPALAERAWDAFLLGKGDQVNSDSMVARADWSLTRIDGPEVLEPVEEAGFLGTNGCAQYGLSAIANLALIGDHLPAQIPYLEPGALETVAELETVGGGAVTYHLAGDSTVAACPPTEFPMSGWGALLERHVDAPVRNLAVGGGTTESCLRSYWPELLDGITPGDTVLLQFGHNDQKDPELLGAREGYAERLRGMVADVRSREAQPVLCTSVERRRFEGERIAPSHGDYPDTVRDLAHELDVPLIDLQVFTAWLYEDLGVAESRSLLSHYPKGLHATWPDGLVDDTHFQRRGADKVAAFVAWSLRAIERRDGHRLAAGDPRGGGLNPDATANRPSAVS